MGTIFCVSNQKGGVGKTTTVNGLAMALREMGFRVLCVDFDPQGNLSFSLKANARIECKDSIYQVIKKEQKVDLAIQHTALCDVLASSLLLSGLEAEFSGKGREYLLRQTLAPLADVYDVILIDTPPNLGLLTINSFTVADYVLIPVLCDIYSIQGLIQINDTLRQVRARSNPNIKVAGILLNRYNPKDSVCKIIRETTEKIAADLEMPLFATMVPSSIALTKAQIQQKNMMSFSPKTNKAVGAYRALAEELLTRGVLRNG